MLKTVTKYKFILLTTAAFGLAGCDENGEFKLPSFGGDTAATPTSTDAPSVRLVERDVEAPDVFSVSENGLWDGRPSLGGVWVAHPDVKDPERVIIRNTANGKFVIGALFRRERENPGPSLQVSSDAAEELGLLAGAPSKLEVVALRRQEGPAEPTIAATEELTGPAPVTATSLDAEPLAPAPAAPTPAPTPAPAPAPMPAPTASADPLTGAAAIAIAAAEQAALQPTVTDANLTPVTTPAPRASSIDKPYVQIGIFSVEANASATSQRLRNDGLLATVLQQESQGRAFWRVIVGPSPTVEDRAAVLGKVKALGFTDAYSVTN